MFVGEKNGWDEGEKNGWDDCMRFGRVKHRDCDLQLKVHIITEIWRYSSHFH